MDDMIPNKEETFTIIKLMTNLSVRLTNSLGNYESTFLNAMDNHGRRAVEG